MKKFIILSAALALGAFITAPQANARGNDRACRDYTKSGYYHGRYETGFAKACHVGNGYWEVIELSGPVSLRDPLITMMQTDVFNLGGLQISISSSRYQPRYYYSQPTYVYYAPRYKTKPVHYYNPKPAHYYKPDHSNHWTHNNRYDRHHNQIKNRYDDRYAKHGDSNHNSKGRGKDRH